MISVQSIQHSKVDKATVESVMDQLKFTDQQRNDYKEHVKCLVGDGIRNYRNNTVTRIKRKFKYSKEGGGFQGGEQGWNS